MTKSSKYAQKPLKMKKSLKNPKVSWVGIFCQLHLNCYIYVYTIWFKISILFHKKKIYRHCYYCDKYCSDISGYLTRKYHLEDKVATALSSDSATKIEIFAEISWL